MFIVYSSRGSIHRRVADVNIAGVLGNHIAQRADAERPAKNENMAWSLSGRELCRAVMKQQNIPKQDGLCKIVIDATWGRTDALLLEIDRVWGYSSKDWTPLLLRMRFLYKTRKRPGGRATPILHFRRLPKWQGLIHEFLYLKCGHTGGRRSWGRMGYTNAVLLWPDALAYLLRQIGFERKVSRER
jgi:hypothetical protein